jgi:hypothetical protein
MLHVNDNALQHQQQEHDAHYQQQQQKLRLDIISHLSASAVDELQVQRLSSLPLTFLIIPFHFSNF